MIETASLEGLDRNARALADADSAPAVFRTLLESLRLVSPCGAIFLVRQGQIKGWNSFGYPDAARDRQKAFSEAVSKNWLTKPDDDPPEIDFGQGASEQLVRTAIVKGRPIAVVVATRTGAEGPWFPEAMSVLVTVAQLRLTYMLLEKKLGAAATPAVKKAAPPAASAESAGVSLVDDAGPAAPPNAEVAAAERFAKLVATDIRLYNEEGVMAGRREGDLVERLGPEMARGKEAFLKRHGSLGPVAVKILRAAFVHVLAGGDETLVPDSLFD